MARSSRAAVKQLVPVGQGRGSRLYRSLVREQRLADEQALEQQAGEEHAHQGRHMMIEHRVRTRIELGQSELVLEKPRRDDQIGDGHIKQSFHHDHSW